MSGPALHVGRTEPRVGIGMPVYNGEEYIREAIESLLGQTFGDLELVIADNRSTDGTESICREYVALDRRVRYHRNDRNLGGPGNFRRVFALCRGEYHKWSTADDWSDRTVLEKSVAVLDDRPDVVLVYPKTRMVDRTGTPFQDYEDDLDLQEESPSARLIRLLKTIDRCHAHLGVIRRAAMARTDLIGGELWSDTRFLAELSLYGKFIVLPEYLLFRRWHEASSSWEQTDMSRQRAYYDPEKRTRFGMHTWRRLAGLFAGAARAPIGVGEKWRLMKYLGRRARWDRYVLYEELKLLLRGSQPEPR
jgi:glycosyltransferase involved in cell wall biosynthesis